MTPSTNVRQLGLVTYLELTSAMGDDDFNRFGHIKLEIVSLGPECNMLELVGSGLSVAGWNDDILGGPTKVKPTYIFVGKI